MGIEVESNGGSFGIKLKFTFFGGLPGPLFAGVDNTLGIGVDTSKGTGVSVCTGALICESTGEQDLGEAILSCSFGSVNLESFAGC